VVWVNVSETGPVVTLELASPETGNALAAGLVEEFTSALARLRASRARAVVVVGRGKHFCTGAHLDELAHLAEAPLAERVADASRLAVLYTELLRCPLLSIAAVNGAAYGGGAGLAAACDLVVAGPTARFQFSENRLGFVPALISVFLPRRIPPARLAMLFFDPEPVDAIEAATAGLVDEIAGDPLARAHERALAVARKTSPAALAETKKLLLALALPHLDQQLAHAAQVNARQREHPECRRGVAEFLAERAFPDWLEE